MQCMALDRYKITRVYVLCLSLCPHKRFVHDSDHNFCPVFLKFETWIRPTHVIAKTKFDGQILRVSGPFRRHKTAFGGTSSLSQWTAFQRIR